MGPDSSRPTFTLPLLWLAQFASLLGTDVSRFALRIWTFQHSGSTAQFALVTLFSEAPAALIAPLAGAVVDRYPRKTVMLAADALAAAATLCLFMLWTAGSLQAYHIYAANAVQGAAATLQSSAFIASISLLVPRHRLIKVAGWNQAASGLAMLIAPLISSYLIQAADPIGSTAKDFHYGGGSGAMDGPGAMGLQSAMNGEEQLGTAGRGSGGGGGLSAAFAVEFVTFVAATAVTVLCLIPELGAASGSAGRGHGVGHRVEEARQALVYVGRRRGLLALLLLLAMGQFANGAVQVLMTPLMLGMAGPTDLALVLTFSGLGAMFGFILPAVWGGPKTRRVYSVLGCVLLQGVMLGACGVGRSPLAVEVGGFLFMFFVPLHRAAREAIWQRKVEPEMQGRVFALQHGLSRISLPFAAVVAGPLCDTVFDPAVSEGGPLSQSTLGRAVGSGKGRGAALMFVTLGLSCIVSAVAGFLYGPLRRVDVELKDWADKKERARGDGGPDDVDAGGLRDPRQGVPNTKAKIA